MNFSKMDKVQVGDIVRIRETVTATDTVVVRTPDKRPVGVTVTTVPANAKTANRLAIVRDVFDCADASQGQLIFADVLEVPKGGKVSMAEVEKLAVVRQNDVFSREQVRPLARPAGDTFYGFE